MIENLRNALNDLERASPGVDPMRFRLVQAEMERLIAQYQGSVMESERAAAEQRHIYIAEYSRVVERANRSELTVRNLAADLATVRKLVAAYLVPGVDDRSEVDAAANHWLAANPEPK